MDPRRAPCGPPVDVCGAPVVVERGCLAEHLVPYRLRKARRVDEAGAGSVEEAASGAAVDDPGCESPPCRDGATKVRATCRYRDLSGPPTVLTSTSADSARDRTEPSEVASPSTTSTPSGNSPESTAATRRPSRPPYRG